MDCGIIACPAFNAPQETTMINTGDLLPDVTLYEYNNDEGACAIGPNAFSVHERCKQKKKWLCSVCPARSRLPAPNATSRVMSLRHKRCLPRA